MIARIYKARYFPYGSFWTAGAYAPPSYSWRSIFASSDLLTSGSHWLIGNGADVFIWSNNWIPGVPSSRPSASLAAVHNLARVQEFILSPRIWNKNLVRGTFIHSDAEAILSIPLSPSSPPDRLVWNQEQKGFFFPVKSAYRLELSSIQVTNSEPIRSNVSVFGRGFCIPRFLASSVKFCIWKLCHNILPTLDQLASRWVVLESQACPLCNVADETNIHLGQRLVAASHKPFSIQNQLLHRFVL